MIIAFIIMPLASQFLICTSAKGQKMNIEKVSGMYEKQESSEKLELRSDGTYI